MKVMIIGGGGREHVLAWRLRQSALVTGLVASPGNPGIAQCAECLPVPPSIGGYADLALAHKIDLTVVGPEGPLIGGVVDHFRQKGLKIIGPTQAASRLEGSKIYAKQFFHRAGIPTARSVQVFSYDEAVEKLRSFSSPVVIKADGLAAGKGVVIAFNETEALSAITQLGPLLVIEEFLEGEEISYIGLSDGRLFLPFAPTQDHKQAYDGDQGPNTGGMGAICDSRILNAAQNGKILDEIMLPTLAQLRKEGTPFTGFLYAGLMMTSSGPKVLEFNVRLGDPETQALLHSYEADFADVLRMGAHGIEAAASQSWGAPSVCVVIAAKGYPGEPVTGTDVRGIAEAEASGAVVFQAGTREAAGRLETVGGRVLGVTAGGETLGAAIDNAYAATKKIQIADAHYRRDIGHKGLKRW